MKKYLVLMLVVLIVGISSLAIAGSGATIVGSLHDLSGNGWGTDQICVFCHTPHDGGRASVATGVLWNHELTTATFTPYSSVSIDGIPADVTGQPVGTAKMCLSCHDGSVALDAFGGGAGTPGRVITTGKVPRLTDGANLDLRGTHPISITYNVSDLQLKDPAVVTLGSINQTVLDTVLENYTVGGVASKLIQCMSCHDVHDTNEAITGTKFLRASIAGSALCLKCHDK